MELADRAGLKTSAREGVPVRTSAAEMCDDNVCDLVFLFGSLSNSVDEEF